MTLRDLLRKKDKIKDNAPPPADSPPVPPMEFTFMRSDTNTEELIRPPSYPDIPPRDETEPTRKRFSRLRSSSTASNVSTASKASSTARSEKRLSERLHIHSHSRASSAGSVNVPSDLPTISDDKAQGEEKEALWEERATILAQEPVKTTVPHVKDGLSSAIIAEKGNFGERPKVTRNISNAEGDVSDKI